jgi:hypothetical protein
MYFGPICFAPAGDSYYEISNVHAGADKVPQFTFNLSKGFVNAKSLVSTGFLVFFPVLFGF